MTVLQGKRTAADFLEQAKALKHNSNQAIRSDLQHLIDSGFTPSCSVQELQQYLVDTVQLDDIKRRKSPQSLDRFLSSLRAFYRENPALRNVPCPADDPVIKRLMTGIRSSESRAPKSAKPLTIEQLDAVFKHISLKLLTSSRTQLERLVLLRDRAIIASGFWYGIRAEAFESLLYQDVTYDDATMVLYLRKEKTTGSTQKRVVRYQTTAMLDARMALDSYVTALSSLNYARDSHLFAKVTELNGSKRLRSGVGRVEVQRILHQYLSELGMSTDGISAHSLRHSFALWAVDKGMSTDSIMLQGGWNSLSSLLRYMKDHKREKEFQRALGHSESDASVAIEAHVDLSSYEGNQASIAIPGSVDE